MIEDGANFKGAIEIERSGAKVVTDSGTLLAPSLRRISS
jgi:hypothetical protein